LNGLGTFKWSDGKYFDGYWKNNQMNGVGKYFWPEGKEYEG